MHKHRVGIDCRLAGQRHAGIGRYVVELVKRVTAHTDIEWVLFYSQQEQLSELFPESTIPPHCQTIHVPVMHYTLREQVDMHSAFKRAKLDLLHVPHFNIPMFYSEPLVVTIHDLLWHEHRGTEVTTLPAWQYWIKYFFYKQVTKAAVDKATTIFVPTKVVKDTLLEYYPISEGKTVITPEGISDKLLEQAKELKNVKNKSKQLLYVGSLYPHKNVELIIASLIKLPDYNVTIVSSRTVFRDTLEKSVIQKGLQKRVRFLSNVSDQVLAELYASATALVQPSLSEGFGLTGLEALAFNTPVLASDIPVFHEVYQDAAVYFNPKLVESFCAAVKELSKTSVRTSVKKVAPAVVKKNTWKTLAETTYEHYLRILKSK